MAVKKVSPDEKALQYIALGRVRVIMADADIREAHVHVHSSSQPAGDPYYVQYHGSAWHCDCPARVSPCVHIRAVQKIIEFPVEKPTLTTSTYEVTSVDALLDG